MNQGIKHITPLISVVLAFSLCFSGCKDSPPEKERITKEIYDTTPTKKIQKDLFPILDSKYFQDNIAILYFNERAYYVNNYGEFLKAYPFYDYADKNFSPLHPFNNGLAAAWKRYRDGKLIIDCYYVDTTGRIAIDEVFDLTFDFKDGYAMTVLKNKDGNQKKRWCLINKSGKHIIEADGMDYFYKNLIWIRKSNDYSISGDWGLAKIDTINDSYNMVVDFKYNIIGRFIKDVCWVEKITEKKEFESQLKQRALMNIDGNLITPWYDNLTLYDSGLSLFRKNKEYGVLDISGNVILQPQNDYNKAKNMANSTLSVKKDNYHEDLGAVHNGGKYGFIDTSGNLVIAYKYDKVSEIGFSGGLAKVQIGEDEFFINKKGECIIGCIPMKKKVIH